MFILVDICFFFKQKTAYEMRISDWSSDVCSSDLAAHRVRRGPSSVRCGGFDLLRRAFGAGSHRTAPLGDGARGKCAGAEMTMPLLIGDRKSTRLNSSH